MSGVIQRLSRSVHRELARGREGLGSQLVEVTKAGRFFLKETKRHNRVLNRRIRGKK